MSDTTSQMAAPKTSHSALWSAADLWVQQITQLLSFVLIGNWLGPEIVGTMTMAIVTSLFFSTFLESGFNDALVQKDGLTQDDVDSAFWLMIAFGTAAALILWLITPLIAAAFHMPKLNEILPLMAIGLPFTAVAACFSAVLQRQLKFKQLATRSIFAYATSFIAAFVLARLGYGIYALVAFFLLVRILDAGLLLAISGIRPRFVVTKVSLDHIVQFGKHRVAHQVVTFFSQQLDRLVIGFFLGPQALGLYAVAERLVGALVSGISGVLARVAFPVLSAQQNNRAAFDSALRDFFTAANLISLPIFVGLALTSKPLIHLMFTANWDGAVPLMMVICSVGLVHPSNYVLTAATNARGRPQLVLTVSIIVFFMRLAASLFAQQYGVMAVALANAIVYVLSLPVFLVLARTTYGRDWRYYFSESGSTALAACAMAAVVFAVECAAPGLNAIEMLALSVTVGVASYVGTLRLVAPDLFGRALNLVTNKA